MLTTTDPALESLFEEVKEVERLLTRSPLRALDRDHIGLLTLAPLVGETLHQLEVVSGRSLDGLYRALKDDPLQTTDVLSRVSILIFVGHLLHYKAAQRPDQETRRRVVIAGDDSLLPHSWESGQEGVKVLKDVVSKAYVKAHNMVVVYAVIGDGTICFPLLLQLHNPQNKGVTKVSVLAQAISFLQDRLEAWGLSLEGIDIVFDHWYLKPGVVEAAQQLEMVITTTLAKNEIVRLDNGKNVQLDYYLYHLVQTPIHYDRRLGKLGYYWRFFATHKLLGRVLIIVRRREKRKGKYYAYDFLVTTDLNAKAITVLRLIQKRWKIEVFFRESKQHLGLAKCFFHDFQTILLHCRLCALTYLILMLYRRKLRLPARKKTIGKLKQRLQQPLLEYFQQAA
jgi:hypothetical protein